MTTTAIPLPKWPEMVAGGKHVRILAELAGRMRDADAHGNRKLFLDDVFVALLLAFYNPTLRSLRTIEDFSRTRQAQRHLSVTRIARSTMADAQRLVDPSRLEPILTAVRAELAAAGRLSAGRSELPELVRQIVAVDGTHFAAAADVAWAVQHRTRAGKARATVRLDLRVDVGSWVPEVVLVSGNERSETQAAGEHIRPGTVYVADRGIFSFELIRAWLDAGASFVVRRREAGTRCPRFEPAAERPLAESDRAAGVVADRTGRLAGSEHRDAPETMLREVTVSTVGRDGKAQSVRLLTDLTQPTAFAVAEIYRLRWQIELFFRWLKVYARFDHLTAHSPAGVLLNFYVATVGVLLMYLHMESRPSKYAFSLLGLAAAGAADLDEIVPILRDRERQIARERERRRRNNAALPAG